MIGLLKINEELKSRVEKLEIENKSLKEQLEKSKSFDNSEAIEKVIENLKEVVKENALYEVKVENLEKEKVKLNERFDSLVKNYNSKYDILDSLGFAFLGLPNEDCKVLAKWISSKGNYWKLAKKLKEIEVGHEIEVFEERIELASHYCTVTMPYDYNQKCSIGLSCDPYKK